MSVASCETDSIGLSRAVTFVSTTSNLRRLGSLRQRLAVELLPALLLWGIGLGLLTPAVVAAALGAVPSGRSGLAAAVNNTAPQADGAIGIAIFGALAGSPDHAGFLTGLHAAAPVATALIAAAALATEDNPCAGARTWT